MENPISLRSAQDPTLVAGIYNMCDQWCTYCHATAWCLAWRYTSRAQASHGDDDDDRTPADRLVEGVMLLKRLWEAERGESRDVDALAANPMQWMPIAVNDPLVKRAERYAQLASAYLRSRPDFPVAMARHATDPTALEVVAWYHVLVPAKVCRALFSAAHGDAILHRDALASAKVALLGMDRSLEALAALMTDDEDPRLPVLLAHLQRLRRDVDARFPDARAFVRPGLDPSA